MVILEYGERTREAATAHEQLWIRASDERRLHSQMAFASRANATPMLKAGLEENVRLLPLPLGEGWGEGFSAIVKLSYR